LLCNSWSVCFSFKYLLFPSYPGSH
jgi:hypothetical protein